MSSVLSPFTDVPLYWSATNDLIKATVLPAQIILMMNSIAGKKYVHIHFLFLKFFVSHLHAYQQTV